MRAQDRRRWGSARRRWNLTLRTPFPDQASVDPQSLGQLGIRQLSAELGHLSQLADDLDRRVLEVGADGTLILDVILAPWAVLSLFPSS